MSERYPRKRAEHVERPSADQSVFQNDFLRLEVNVR